MQECLHHACDRVWDGAWELPFHGHGRVMQSIRARSHERNMGPADRYTLSLTSGPAFACKQQEYTDARNGCVERYLRVCACQAHLCATVAKHGISSTACAGRRIHCATWVVDDRSYTNAEGRAPSSTAANSPEPAKQRIHLSLLWTTLSS